MHTLEYNTPIVCYDPEGDLYLPLIVLISVMVTVLLMATAPDENNAEENASVSWSATPDPLTYGFDMLGVGGSYTFGQPGVTCNLANGCQGFTQTIGGQVGPFGGSHVEYEDGTYTNTISFLVFYVSLDNLDYDDISSWGAGLTFGASYGAPNTGSGSASLDIDFLGLIRDLFRQGD